MIDWLERLPLCRVIQADLLRVQGSRLRSDVDIQVSLFSWAGYLHLLLLLSEELLN